MSTPKQSKITFEITRTEWHEDEHAKIYDPGARAMRLTMHVLDECDNAVHVEQAEVRISSDAWRAEVERGRVEEIKDYFERDVWHKLVPKLREHFPIAEEPRRESKMWELFPDGDYEGGINRMLNKERDEP